eukprot:2555005-Prymnesium_polylepis.1
MRGATSMLSSTALCRMLFRRTLRTACGLSAGRAARRQTTALYSPCGAACALEHTRRTLLHSQPRWSLGNGGGFSRVERVRAVASCGAGRAPPGGRRSFVAVPLEGRNGRKRRSGGAPDERLTAVPRSSGSPAATWTGLCPHGWRWVIIGVIIGDW